MSSGAMSDILIHFDLGDGATKVVVEAGALSKIGGYVRAFTKGAEAAPVAVVFDRCVGVIYGARLRESLDSVGLRVCEHAIEPGETSKSWNTAGEVHRFLADHEISRDSTIVALGGGVVSDLAGFVAATWMRGVRFVICPTTMEACVDASIGGKTAVNIPGAKNLVGAFHQPALVIIDPTCLATLPERDLRAGLAESIKHAVLFSPSFLAWHESNVEAIRGLAEQVIIELILQNVRLKADIVSRDAKERTGERMLLNFGHTIGHAIEECTGFTLRHGECVALGMSAACRLSRSLGLLDAASVERVERLLARFGLPTRVEKAIDPDRIMAAIGMDKKMRNGTVRFVLLEDIGRPVIRDDVPESLIREAYELLLPGGK